MRAATKNNICNITYLIGYSIVILTVVFFSLNLISFFFFNLFFEGGGVGLFFLYNENDCVGKSIN